MDKNNIPQHIAIIMDGNGRWAKKQGEIRSFGHRNGVDAVRESVEFCAEHGVKFLTLYAFSTENWNRPTDEINLLMSLLVESLEKEQSLFMQNNIRLKTIGEASKLPENCQDQLNGIINTTAKNTGLTLVLALSYSGRWDITQAVKNIANEFKQETIQSLDEIDENLITQKLSTVEIPDPDLLIRTSGELRISNFLLWQLAYSEIYITPVLWPEFTKKDLFEAIQAYQLRERRFGRTSEQIK